MRHLPVIVPATPAVVGRGPASVLMILPPDFDAPSVNRAMRFPPQGPALVAASVALDGVAMRAVDLELAAWREPPSVSVERLDREEVWAAHLRGEHDEGLGALA